MLYEELSGTVIGAAMEVHRLLGPGFLESVYERALALELTGWQIPFERQAPISVIYGRSRPGNTGQTSLLTARSYWRSKPRPPHYAQVLHYLAAIGVRLALLLNFGAKSPQIKRIIR